MSAARKLIFTGPGKGKTTAALGMALRASGHGKKIRILQFVKADATTGEIAAISRIPEITISQTGRGFVPKPDHPDYVLHKEAAEAGLALAHEILDSKAFDIVIFDELCVAVMRGLVTEKDAVALIKKAAPESVLVLTGRGATEALMDEADTVTEMGCIKHGMQDGIPAQIGVEH